MVASPLMMALCAEEPLCLFRVHGFCVEGLEQG
jgi:hypothetical protein